MSRTPGSNSLPTASIRAATPSDAPALRAIALSAGIDAWTVDQYREEAAREDSVILVAEDGESAIGFISGRLVPGTESATDAEIYNVAVVLSRRRKGIGDRLLTGVVQRSRSRGCRFVWLEVRKSNLPAIRFYETHGFVMIATRGNFYANPVEDAIVMRLTLVDGEPAGPA